MHPARPRLSRVALTLGTAALVALTSSGCAARFDRPATSNQTLAQTDGLTPDQGGLPAGSNGQVAPGTAGQPGPVGTGTTVGGTGTTTSGGSGSSGSTGGTGSSGSSGSTGGTGSSGSGGAGGPVPAGDTTGVTDTSITIGLFVPKTGAAPVPPTVDAQAQNYFNYVAQKGGLNGRNVTVKVYDTKSTEADARAAVKQAQTDKIFAAVSLDRLSVEGALMTALHDAHIPHLVAQAPPAQSIPNDAYYIGMNQLHHGTQIADYMAHTLKVTKVGVITEQDPGLYAPRDKFVAEAKSQGVEVVYNESVDASSNNYLSQVQALQRSGAQAVWLYMAPTVAVNIAVESKNLNYHPTWVGNNISWGFNLVLTPAGGALDGAKAFSPWGGLSDARYATFNTVDTDGRTDQDKDIGLAAWGFGQIVAAAIKNAGPQLGRNSFEVAMQNLRTGSVDAVTGAAMCWPPLDFTGGKRYGSGDRSIVLTVKGSGSNAVWATESDYRSAF